MRTDIAELEAIGLAPNILVDIHSDYRSRIDELLVHGDFVVRMLQKIPAAHSLKLRVKDPAHLLQKIVRKKREKQDTQFDVANYTTTITDLIGVRALHLYKGDWLSLHQFIMSTWDVAEPPVAYVRKGDEVQPELSSNCNVMEHPRNYRSVHYVIKFGPTKDVVLAEIQVRTLFEEAWSEIDHKLNYPIAADPLIAQLLRIFNGLSGYADQLYIFIAALHLSRIEATREGLAKDAERETLMNDLQKVRDAKNASEAEKEVMKKTIEHLKKEKPRIPSK